MDLRQLRYFVAVAEELHFGRAAERVHIAQPALSVQIKALEDDLGGQLLARTNRSVALTEPGRLFLAEARATLAQAARSVEVAKRALRGDLGSIRIAYSGSAAYSGVLGRALQDFRQLYPGVEIQLLELAPSEQLGSLQTRSIHVGFLTTLALDLPDNFVAMRLATWPLRIAVPSSHALARLKVIPLEVLRDEPFVVYAGSAADDGLSVLRSFAGFTPKVSHRATNAMMLAALVGAGMGFALIPASLANVAAQTGVTLKAIADFSVDMDVSLAHQRQESEPVVLRFLECVRRVFDVERTENE